MIQFRLSEVAKQLGVEIPATDTQFTGISHDTRTVSPGNLFIAIKGERIDGHDLIPEAIKAGAVAAMVSRHQPDISLPQIVVPDTILALGSMVAGWRKRFQLPLVAVTGSNGKTTVKNMIASIFEAATSPSVNAVLSTSGNLNNAIGLPLTLARLGSQHHYAVLEMGMNHFGEIAHLSAIARPGIAIITNAAASHLAGVGDIAGVAKAKGEIFSGLQENGVAILNADDPFYDYWTRLTEAFTRLTFGLEKKADITATYMGPSRVECRTPQGSFPLELSLPGRHNVQNALAAVAATLAAGISPSAIQQGLANVRPAKGRMETHTLSCGARLIDDTYNANPFSLKAAIAILASAPSEKILVLGDMRELGSEEIALHAAAGKQIAAAGIDRLMTYGTLTQHTAHAFGPKARHFESQAELLHALRPLLKKDLTVLVKGSRSMAMDRIVSELVEENSLSSSR